LLQPVRLALVLAVLGELRREPKPPRDARSESGPSLSPATRARQWAPHVPPKTPLGKAIAYARNRATSGRGNWRQTYVGGSEGPTARPQRQPKRTMPPQRRARRRSS